MMKPIESSLIDNSDEQGTAKGKQPWSTPTLNDLSVKETAAGGTAFTEGLGSRAGS